MSYKKLYECGMFTGLKQKGTSLLQSTLLGEEQVALFRRWIDAGMLPS